MENMEIRRKKQEKRNQQYESEKANKVNDNLQLNVDEQEHLKEMALCVTCNPSISTKKNWLKKRVPETITK